MEPLYVVQPGGSGLGMVERGVLPPRRIMAGPQSVPNWPLWASSPAWQGITILGSTLVYAIYWQDLHATVVCFPTRGKLVLE